jgi:hypothetical protein
MRDIPVLVFSAGATKDCGGPLTNEILAEAFKSDPSLLQQQEALALLQQFLDENFPMLSPRGEARDYPSLPLALSRLDTTIDRKQPFGPNWVAEK